MKLTLKHTLLLSGALMCCACETVRTFYDEDGNVVDPNAPGNSGGDISSRLEKQFNSSFSEKKTEDGVPQAVSNRVSQYQKDLDASARLDKEYSAGSYAGLGGGEYSTMSFSGAGKQYGAREAYSGAMGREIERDLSPDFAKASRGVYGTDDTYAGGGTRSAIEGSESAMGGEYATSESYYSHDMTSGYFETRRENTPPPRVMTRDQYYRKTIEETRTLLGRDNDE